MTPDEARLWSIARGEPTSTDFSGARLRKARFPSCSLVNFDFSRADLRGADASGAYLSGANFSEAKLDKADLVLTDLRQANFAEASLRGANLNAAVLAHANLQSADLREAQLTKAMVAGVNWKAANVALADFRGAVGLDLLQLKLANGWELAIYDTATGRALHLTQDEITSRFGRDAMTAVTNTVFIPAGDPAPTLGDMFTITGASNPDYPPSGNWDFSSLHALRIVQVDDQFAIRIRDEEAIWISFEEHHLPGTVRAVRIVLADFSKGAKERFLECAEAFERTFGQGFRTVTADGRPVESIGADQLRALIQSAKARR